MREAMKDLTPARKIAFCKSFNGMDKDMMNDLMKCKSTELKDGLMKAKTLCGAKKTGSGSGSGAKKLMTTKKTTPMKVGGKTTKKADYSEYYDDDSYGTGKSSGYGSGKSSGYGSGYG